MNAANMRNSCLTGCWLMAGAIGLVIFVSMTVLSAMTVASALLGAAIVTAVLGLLLSWILCRPVDEPVAVARVPQPTGITPGQTVAPQPAAPVPAAAAPSPVATAPVAAATPVAAPVSAPVAAPAPVAETVPETPASVAAPADGEARAAADSEGTAPEAAPEAGAAMTASVAPATATAQPLMATAAAPVAATETDVGAGVRPAGLSAPRDGKGDDLKLIEGIGPALEQRLHDWGIWHFDQIAAWGPAEIAYADQNVPRFKGRASRDKWVAQARIIVTEGIDAFLERAKTNDY